MFCVTQEGLTRLTGHRFLMPVTRGFLGLFAEVGLSDRDGHLMNLASELVIAHFVVIADTRVHVFADVRRFGTKGERLRVLDPP